MFWALEILYSPDVLRGPVIHVVEPLTSGSNRLLELDSPLRLYL